MQIIDNKKRQLPVKGYENIISMKVLMFGWEFPPHISGGLGTACYGLAKGISKFDDIELHFVVPKAYGDEDGDVAKIISAGDVLVKKYKFEHEDFWKEISYIEVGSNIRPYISPDDFTEAIQTKIPEKKHVSTIIETEPPEDSEQTPLPLAEENPEKYNFTGTYGTNLMQEVADYAKVAAEIASKLDFDVIHAHDWLTYMAGIAAREVSGKPLIAHIHATEFDRSGEEINQQVYNIEKAGLNAADEVIAVSNLTRETIVERYGVDDNKITTIYNAVEPKPKVKKKKNVKNVEEKIVSFLGRITYQKGPEFFIEAAAIVLKTMTNVRFVMAGSGDLLHRMIRRAAALGITNKFHFTGFLENDEVERLFAMTDVYVMPSVSEPFGISPLEAMRSKVPVIISKQSGVAEVIQHAIKIDFWDIEAIADAIHGILSYSALENNFVKEAKKEVKAMKWDDAASEIRNLYRRISKNKVINNSEQI